MATSTVPALIDALVAQLKSALPGVGVYDGFALTEDPGDYLMVGVDDPGAEGDANSAIAQQSPGPMGSSRPRDETGEINCVAHSWNGGGDQKAARDAVYGITNAIEGLLRSNPSLGVNNVLWTSFGDAMALKQDQTDQGARALLSFSIAFRSRI